MEKNMNDSLKMMSNIRILRAQTRELPLSILEDMLEKLTVVVTERRDACKAYEAASREKSEKLERYREILLNEGIHPEELLSPPHTSKPREKKEPRPAKYKYVDEYGVEKNWTGQGRTPSIIKKGLEAGKSLNDFLIESFK
jgi:DNA-binding protein H-NS